MTFSSSDLPGTEDDATYAEERHGYPLTAGLEENAGLQVVQPNSAEQPIQETPSPVCPPLTNRGAEITVGVDWLAFSVFGVEVSEVEARLVDFGLDGWTDVDRGAYGYRRQRIGVGGARLLSEGRTPEVHVIVPGRCCGSFTVERMRSLLQYVRAEARCSRLDLAGDEYSRRVLPEHLRAAQLSGHMVTRALRWGYVESGGLGGGRSYYVGTRGSRQFLRVYDKGAQSQGEQDCIRYELEFRDEMACEVVASLCEEESGIVWASRLLSYVDFRNRSVDVNVSRCPRDEWWDWLVAGGQKVRAWSPVRLVTVPRAMRWIERQVMPALAMVMEASQDGEAWLARGLDAGERRWSRLHREAIDLTRSA